MSSSRLFLRGLRTATAGAVLASALFAAGSTSMLAQPSDAISCTPGYSPCIANKASDVDCFGGSGNGPRYTARGVVYKVTGYDRYRLDSDHDHKGCER